MRARAAHAFADSRAEQADLEQARAALDLFMQYQMSQRIPVFYANITRKLASLGMPAAAQALEKEYGNRIGAMPPGPPADKTARHGTLPTHCAKCGGPLHGDEVNWIDAETAECDYCGSPIRAQ